jgi:phage shock protein A
MFKRIRLLIRGFINKYIMELEADNPEIVYDNAIDLTKRSELELREKTAAIVRMTNELEEEKKTTEKALKKVTELINAAAMLPEDQVDMDAAAEQIQLQEQLTEKLEGLTEDWANAEKEEAELREALTEVQQERNKLVREKDSQIGRYRAAQARLAIHERQEGVSLNEVNKSLDGVRGKIKNTIAESQLARDMKNNSLESKVRKFQKATEGLSAKQKFAALRAQQQQKATAPSPKTL